MLYAPTQASRKCPDGPAAHSFDSIPEVFCWTKMGAEAGQPLAAIVRRKELERSAGGGTFAWGIGNSLGGSADLAKRMSTSGDVDVLFTPMKSAPKVADITPSALLLWIYYQDRSGLLATLPEHMLVTSRGGPEKRTHYALLCQSAGPIEERCDIGAFDSAGVRNLASMSPVGASQVTSVVRYCGRTVSSERAYRVAFRAKLYAEGFVKLVEPVGMNEDLIALYEKVCQARNEEAWRSGVRKLRKAALMLRRGRDVQRELSFA